MEDPTYALKPDGSVFAWGWAAIIFGAIFGASSSAAASVGQVIWMALFGIAAILWGISMLVAKLTCDSAGVHYRGLRPVDIAARDVTAVALRRAKAGYGRPALRIEIDQRNGKTLKLTPMQHGNTPKNLERGKAEVTALRQALGIHTEAEPVAASYF